MKREDCVEIGYIAKAFGLKGDLRIVLDVHDLREYKRVKTLYLAKKKQPLVAYEVERITFQANQQINLKLAGINDKDAADNMRGNTLYFPADQLPKLKEGQFYYFEVIGYQVVDTEKGPLGTVKDFIDGNAHDILQMEYQGNEVLIPMTDEFVGNANHEERTIQTHLPAGLLELYMGMETEEEEDNP